MKITTKERFERHIRIDVKSECWLWQGYLHKGYGRFRTPEKWDKAHRASYRIYCGEIPEKINVLHRCDITNCVNPSHLFLGTQRDNVVDMIAKGRDNFAKGIRVHLAKLNPEKAFEIRWRSAMGHRQCDLAREFAVTKGAISSIVKHKTWRPEVHD